MVRHRSIPFLDFWAPTVRSGPFLSGQSYPGVCELGTLPYGTYFCQSPRDKDPPSQLTPELSRENPF